MTSLQKFDTQNEALEWLLAKGKVEKRRIPLPEIKALKWDGKNTIACHSKVTSNIRKKLRKYGQDLLCHEVHFMKDGKLIQNHTEYEIVKGVRGKTKLITTQYV